MIALGPIGRRGTRRPFCLPSGSLGRDPQDDVAVALARPAHGSETIDNRLLEVDEGLPAASVYVQHGPFRQGLGDGDEGGLGDGDADQGVFCRCED
jgi:hypothetical protein